MMCYHHRICEGQAKFTVRKENVLVPLCTMCLSRLKSMFPDLDTGAKRFRK